MNTNRIDFISSYCDRWCERCAFTSRCSAFAAGAAIAMCGDVNEGLELAVGVPQPVDAQRGDEVPQAWMAELDQAEISAEETAELLRRENARRTRTDRTAIMKVARAVSLLSHRWFSARGERVPAVDIVLTEAFEIAQHDAIFVAAKLNRALQGQDRHDEEDDDEHPVQNDWNGSAKVALISLERSEAAWRVIAQASCDETPGAIADQLRDLRRDVEHAFPNARDFVRPGFDEPGR